MCFRSKKKTRERKKPLKLKKPDSITAQQLTFPLLNSIYVQLGDNNQVVSYAEEIW